MVFMDERTKKEIYIENLNKIKKINPKLSIYRAEKLSEQISCTNIVHNKEDIKQWIKERKNAFQSSVKEIPINKTKGWKYDSEGNLNHSSGKFFSIVGVRVGSNANREIGSKGWDQPIVKEFNYKGGLLGLVRTKIDDLPHYLVQTRFEPGNYGLIQLGPTLQATFSNFNQEHGGRKPYYSEFFNDYEDKKNYLFNNWLAEDGGKFLKKRHLGLVKNVEYKDIEIINDDFMWLSFFQIVELIDSNSLVNPHLSRLIYF